MKLPSRYQPTGQYFGGGQGVVSVWTDTLLGRNVAVKVLSTHGIGGSLRSEATLLAAIKSKHVVELFDMGADPSTRKEYLIMEFVQGSDLDGYVPKDIPCLYLTLYQISSGLVDIHAANCIHRDLKPDNLKRDGSDIIKIIDFGIGANRNPVNTSSGRGTDGYRGPEYYLTPIRLTSATDVYAFGVIAHKFCFGTLDPALLNDPPGTPPSFTTALIGASRSKVSSRIAATLDRCFNLDPTLRPTAAEIKGLFAKHLLRDQHVANFVHAGKMYSVSQSSRQYRISGARGTFELLYDGLDFTLNKVEREVFVNGVPANAGIPLPGSCVITIGGGSGPNRVFIPFNVSHPEVVL